ncbi:pre-B-cell leukemia homeobox interacting protein 1b [Diretmus argenteus]
MSEGNSTNSWTILTPEETVAETLRPEGTQHHEESATSTAGHTEPDCRVEGASSAVERLSVENQQVSEDKTPALSGDTPTITPTVVSDVPPPCALDIPGQSESLSEVPAQSSPDPDSFSDSYTHINPSPDEPPASLLTTETLGASGLTQEEATPAQEGALHPLNGEELGQEEEESEISQSVTDLGKQADSPVDSEVGEERNGEKGDEGETEMRRRSLLAALERIGRREEEEEEEEEDEFQLPQRDDDSGFSVNKCILGAVILLGLGTIFFSGVFMDLDEEGDYGAKELRDAEVPLKQEWLNPEVPLSPVDADKTELLNKLAKGNQQFTVLQAQFQAQKDELKVAKGQAAEGAKERLRREEVERENGRLKKEMASLPLLQKENEKMKRELESVPALQKELETLKATVAELKLSTGTTGQREEEGGRETGRRYRRIMRIIAAGDSMQGTAGPTEKQGRKPWEGEKLEKKKERNKEKYDMGEKKEWKEREKFEWKEGEKRRKDEGKMERKEKEWKKGKHEQGKYDQEKGKEGKQWRQDEEKKELKERGDWKKEKASRGDEGKPWKDREGKKEWKEKSERKEWKERGEKKQWKENDWKKEKQEKWNDGKEYRGKDEKKERKGGKDHGEWHKGKEEWKGEKEWKKGKDKESEKEKWVKKDWKEKGEKNEWKKDGDWKSRNGKDQGKEWKGKDERKQWGKKESKEGEWKREGVKEERSNGDWKKERGSFHKHKDESKYNKVENHHHHHHHDHHKEHLWQGPGDRKPPQTHRQSSLEQPDYWLHQREKLQHNPSPSHRCDSVDTCAQAEGLIPVPLPEFEAVLQSYLAKAEGVGVDASKREELSKLATEFFKDGVFVHDQMSFEDFVEDVEDILEDMVEGEEDDEDDGDGKDDSIEEEMDGFNREAMNKFSVPEAGQREERKKGEWRKESVRGRG